MLRDLLTLILAAGLMGSLIGCKGHVSPIPETDAKAFGDYWFSGKAEISSYALSQSRYGSTHDGNTVMVFVAEDFSKAKHVKLDEPAKHQSDAVKVLKLNTSKKFITGVYDYSMMSSVYMPVDHEEHPHSLKLTSGTQEWCGQTFMQANWKGNRYEIQQMSYFESEGDSKINLSNGLLEDELWTLIRIAPNTLPIGEVKMIASSFYIRLSHKENKVYDALASLDTIDTNYLYTIQYPDLKRTLEIEFEKSFPYRIMGWTEVYGENEVTTGKLLNSIMSAYWEHNRPADEVLRDDLDLIH